MNKLFLKDYKEMAEEFLIKEYGKRTQVINIPCNFGLDHVLNSFNQHLKGNMYYNIGTGKTYLKNTAISSYSNKTDIPVLDISKLEDIESILWEFKCHIFSSANRLSLGYATI